ncbi:hypothetical protein [Thiolapillus sp.]
MRRVKSCNTGPEMVVRHLLHKLGYRSESTELIFLET